MTPQELLHRIKDLPEKTPRYLALQEAISTGTSRAWHTYQKEHWQGWLGEYDGPGAYGRSEWASRGAAFVWNHIQCAPMLFWLAEALALPEADLDRAFDAVLASPNRGAAQCGALRKAIPWAMIEAALPPPPVGPLGKLNALISRLVGRKD